MVESVDDEKVKHFFLITIMLEKGRSACLNEVSSKAKCFVICFAVTSCWFSICSIRVYLVVSCMLN